MDWDSISVGILGSFYFAGFLTGCFAIPKLVSMIGHIRCFATLSALMTATILMFALSSSFTVWLVMRFITGVAISGLYLVIESWLNEQTNNEVRGGVLAAYTTIVLSGLATGQLLLKFASMGGGELFIIAGALIALASIPICVTRKAQPSQLSPPAFSPLLVLKTSRVAFFGALTSGIINSVFYTLGPVYGLQIGLDISEIGSMMALGIFGGALVLLPIGRLSDKKDRRVIIATIMLTGAVVAFIARFLPASFMPAVMFLFCASFMPIQALCLAQASDNIGDQSFLEVGTSLLVINAVGSILGPLSVAQTMQYFGTQSFFLFNALVLAIGGALTVLFIRTRAPSQDSTAKFQATTTAAAQGALEIDPRNEAKQD
jgi:MFS family permease